MLQGHRQQRNKFSEIDIYLNNFSGTAVGWWQYGMNFDIMMS